VKKSNATLVPTHRWLFSTANAVVFMARFHTEQLRDLFLPKAVLTHLLLNRRLFHRSDCKWVWCGIQEHSTQASASAMSMVCCSASGTKE
jgi:hypothetical protein